MIFTTHKRPHRHDILDMEGRLWRYKNKKSNMRHNSTRRRYYYRQGRKLKPYFRDMILDGVTWNIDLRDMFEE